MKIVILYASLTGYTEFVANEIRSYLITAGYDPTCFDVDTINEIPSCDLLLFGCSTYHAGDLSPVAELFIERLRKEGTSINAPLVAVFGLGESIYPDFCAATGLAMKFFEARGCRVFTPGLKLDMLQPQSENWTQIEDWLNKVLHSE